MFFKDIIGQDEVKKKIDTFCKIGQIAHAQLFCGPEGIGKLPLALAYARYIQCTNRGEDDACGCVSVMQTIQFGHASRRSLCISDL